MAEEQARERERTLIALVRRKAQRYLKTPGVTSVGVGYRQKRNEETGEIETTDDLCIQFTVAQKLTLESLQDKSISPLPKSFEDDDGTTVPVQVIERSFQPTYEIVSDPDAEASRTEITPHEKRRSRMDPVVPGISVGRKGDDGAGTIGAVVYDNETGAPFILSNWHVLQGIDGKTGDDIVQPGLHDDDDPENNRVGRLVRSHLGLAGDCAVASIENRGFAEEVLELNVVPTRVAKVSLGDKVVKSGRTTGVTFGVVTRVGVTADILYDGVGRRKIGCFEIRPDPATPPDNGEISQSGDSGSLWLIAEDESTTDIAVGLHVAGEVNPAPSAEHALACNIHSVLKKLNVSLVDTVSPVVDDEALWNEVLGRLDSLETRFSTIAQRLPIPKDAQQQAYGAQGAATEGLRVYGNWCGPGHGSGQPIDDLDRACMEHDKCYGRKGYLDCECDGQLVKTLDRIIASGNVSPEARASALAIRGWFTVQPCVTWIGGIPVPTGTGGTTRAIASGVKAVRRAGKTLWKRVRSWF